MCVGMFTGCVASCCASLTCSACGKLGSGISQVTRLCYGIYLLIATLLSVAMLSDVASGWINDAFEKIWFSKALGDEAKVPKEMIGALSVYRVMSAVFIFHAVLALCLIGVKSSTDMRAKLQNSGMGVKFLLYIAIIVAMFFAPAQPFERLAGWPFKLCGALFILVQLVFLVAFSFDLNESLINLAEEQEAGGQEERRCIWANWAILLSTLGFYGFTFTVFGLLVHMNETKGGCTSAIVVGGCNLACMIFVSFLSVTEHVRGATNGPGNLNGVFQSSMISAYAAFQILSAFGNHPETQCHLYGDSVSQGSVAYKIIALLCTFVAVLWSAIRSGSNTFFENSQDADPEIAAPLVESEEKDGELIAGTKHTNDEVEHVTYSYSQFHVMFALAATYIANLLTKWGEINIEEGLSPEDGQEVPGMSDSELSVGLKIGASFMCFAFYCWVMLAPPCFPDREFAN